MHVALNGLLLSRHFSGVEVAIFHLAQALAEHGHGQYTLYVPGRFPSPTPSGAHFTTRRTLLPTQLRPARILWEQLVLPFHLRRKRFDLLHAPGYLAPLAARLPVVVTVYDLIALQFPAWCKPTNRWNYGLMLPRAIRKAAGIIVPSEATRKDLIALFPSAAEKVRTVPLAVGDEFRKPADASTREAVRARYGLPERFILFVGNIEPKKNLVRLVQAYQLMRQRGTQHRLVIAGESAWGTAEVERCVRRYGLREWVSLPGVVRAEDLPTVYALADVFAFPSLYEGFGLPPLEAMASGVPVVASDRGSVPEVTGEAALLVDPLRRESIAAAIENVLEHPELRRDLVSKGKERVTRFTWEKTAHATEAVYEDVLNTVKPELQQG